MKRTGFVYHEDFARFGYPVLRERIQPAFEDLKAEGLLEKVFLIKPKPIQEDLLRRVHSVGMVEAVKETVYYRAALLSASGVVFLAEKVWVGELDNGFALTGTAGHHAGKDRFWGFCYFNDVALAIENLRWRFKALKEKFTVLDTDSHHGDGTRDIFQNDLNVQHICFCSRSETSDDGTKIDVAVPYSVKDEGYVKLVRENFVSNVERFKPKMVFWHFGYDTHKNDYGSRGLTEECYIRLTKLVKDVAEKVCDGKLVVVLCGGSKPDIAKNIIPKMVKILLEE
ncbi:MAG: histone deacetylase [Candidatus Hecatellales archaeon]|nr:MAG: histone deacetylase [Candidatus Hecatellales archaeon]